MKRVSLGDLHSVILFMELNSIQYIREISRITTNYC